MAASKEKPTLVFVPGSFSQPTMFDRVKQVLQAAPYSVPASNMVDSPLLSANLERPEGPATLYDDAAAIRLLVQKLADDGKDVVLVISSYGGMPSTEAVPGLSKSSRSALGQPGGVVSMCFLAAFMPKIGDSVAELNGRMPGDSPYISLEYSREFAAAVFGDLKDPNEQETEFRKMKGHSRVSFENTITGEGWKEVKNFYYLPENDYVISPDLQRRLIEHAKSQGADVEVLTTNGSHVPMIGREEEVAKFVAHAADW
jgi:pimeloyl-ACP methyl ester carboxylesterase